MRTAQIAGCIVVLAALALFGTAPRAHADVDRVEILERTLVANGKAFGNVGPYERLRGRLYFTIEGNAAENQAVTDIRLTPRDSLGRIRFSADFVLLKPLDATRSNGRLLYEAADHGDVQLLQLLNDGAPGNQTDGVGQAGNGFLMEQGYALLWTGWDWDAPLGGDRLRADIPVALDNGTPIQGVVAGEIAPLVPTGSARYAADAALGYEPASDADARLLVRDSAFGPRMLISRDHWQFGRKVDGRLINDPGYITLNDGFKPGLIYTVIYTARGPHVDGLGLVGIRDALLFFHHENADHYGARNPLLENGGSLPHTALAFGHGQSARVLQTMIAQGLAVDGHGRLAFDGALISGAGSGKGSFNARFGQPGRTFSPDLDLDFPNDWFPFTAASETDSVLEQTGGVLDALTAAGAVPKIIYVNSGTEYWAHGGSLTHISVDGKSDIAPDHRTRIYFVAGGSRLPAITGERGTLAQCQNPLDYRPLLRALLLHLDSWASLKKEPPASIVPTLGDTAIGKLSDYLGAMPKIPGLRMPTRLLEIPRLDSGPGMRNGAGVATTVPPKVGRLYAALVPLPDGDGIDKAGVRLPAVAVPLGTYTGWNLLNAATGAPDRVARKDGSFIPFARNENERIAAGDPRPSIAERYPTRDAYIEAYAAAALALANKEMIIGSDINGMVDHAGKFYDVLMTRPPQSESCAFTKTP